MFDHKREKKVSGSLFSGAGIGDVGIEWGLGIPVLAACELIPSRAELIRRNFPNTKVFQGDIWNLKDDYIRFFKEKNGSCSPWLLTLSPPCQGMSSNGAGRISSEIKAGKRPKEDQRNRLILPGIEILEALKPKWFILENVRRMENTIIRNEKDRPESILHCLQRRLNPLGYTIYANILNFCDYGIPHHRERLITIGCRIPQITALFSSEKNVFSNILSPFHPVPTHGAKGSSPWITLADAIKHLPSLDSRSKTKDENDKYHCVPKWNDQQYFWMQHTPEGESAFDNLICIECKKKVNNPSAVRCACGASLPRPQINRNGENRLINGFKSSYRRMKWGKPGGTLTMNSGVISSDLKGHPEQNRVLSVREILILSTLDSSQWNKEYSFDGVRFGRMSGDQTFSEKLVREVIGESIPPIAMKKIVEHIISLEKKITIPDKP